MSKIIAVDVDDVCADLITAWLEQYNKEWNDNLSPEDIRVWDWVDVLTKRGVQRDKVYNIINNQRFYSVVKPVAGAKEAIEKIREMGYRVVFLTTAMNGHAGAKFRWLRFYGFLTDEQSKDYFETADKGLINADLIIDDKPQNVVAFLEKGKFGLLFDRPWNKDFEDKSYNYKRVSSWGEIVDFIEKLDFKTEEIKLYTDTKIKLKPTKFDEKKPRWDLLPYKALSVVVEIFTIGANKYGVYNWSKAKGMRWGRVYAAVMRHMTAWYTGEDLDPETKQSHLAHAACGILFLLHYTIFEKYKENDDRLEIVNL